MVLQIVTFALFLQYTFGTKTKLYECIRAKDYYFKGYQYHDGTDVGIIVQIHQISASKHF